MCGRSYRTVTDDELAVRYSWQKLKRRPLGLVDAYNIAPTQLCPVVLSRDGERDIELMRWGLVPPHEPEFRTRLSTINARIESAAQSRLYGEALRRSRCIWPVSGFYEWKREGNRKRPFAVRLKGEPIMSIAGLWEAWHPGRPDERHSFSVLTRPANEAMSRIHDRMPVILWSREQEERWLDPSIRDSRAIADVIDLARKLPEEALELVEVSQRVNQTKNDGPELLEPVKERQGELF